MDSDSSHQKSVKKANMIGFKKKSDCWSPFYVSGEKSHENDHDRGALVKGAPYTDCVTELKILMTNYTFILLRAKCRFSVMYYIT